MHAVAGIASSSNAQGASTSQGGSSGQAATLASLPPTGPYPRNRRNSGSTVGMDTAVARRCRPTGSQCIPKAHTARVSGVIRIVDAVPLKPLAQLAQQIHFICVGHSFSHKSHAQL